MHSLSLKLWRDSLNILCAFWCVRNSRREEVVRGKNEFQIQSPQKWLILRKIYRFRIGRGVGH